MLYVLFKINRIYYLTITKYDFYSIYSQIKDPAPITNNQFKLNHFYK